MAPSPSGLQKLIDICMTYASQYELSFNAKKTKVMCFKPKGMSDLYVPDFTLGEKFWMWFNVRSILASSWRRDYLI